MMHDLRIQSLTDDQIQALATLIKMKDDLEDKIQLKLIELNPKSKYGSPLQSPRFLSLNSPRLSDLKTNLMLQDKQRLLKSRVNKLLGSQKQLVPQVKRANSVLNRGMKPGS